MKKLLIGLLAIGSMASAYSSSCANFNSLKHKNCMIKIYDYGYEDESWTSPKEVDVSITKQEDGDSIHFYELLLGKYEHESIFGIKKPLISQRNNVTLKRWATCSDTELILNTEEVVKNSDQLSFFTRFKDVYSLETNKVIVKSYQNRQILTSSPYPTIPQSEKDYIVVEAVCELSIDE